MKRLCLLAFAVLVSASACSSMDTQPASDGASAAPPPMMAYCLYGNEPGCGTVFEP